MSYKPDTIDGGVGTVLMIMALANNGDGVIIALCVAIFLTQWALRHTATFCASVQAACAKYGVPLNTEHRVVLFFFPGMGNVARPGTGPLPELHAQPIAEAPQAAAPAPALPVAAADMPAGIVPVSTWFDLVNSLPDEAPHLMIIGDTGAGKTVLAQALLVARPGLVVVADPKPKPGKWGGMPFVSVDDEGELGPIDQLLKSVLQEIKARLAQMRDGRDDFTPLTLVVDEFPMVKLECPHAPLLLKRLGSIGRELRVRLIALTQSNRVKTLGIEGEGDALGNFTIIRLGKPAIAVQPSARSMARPAVLEWRGEQLCIETAGLKDVALHPISPSRWWRKPEGDNLLAGLLSSNSTPAVPVLAPDSAPETPESGSTVQYGTSGTSSALTPDTTSTPLPMDDEAVMIRNLLHQFSKNKVAELLGGSKSTAYRRIARALGEHEE